jgi:uncharacterized repeat protein (TIGR03809 family)
MPTAQGRPPFDTIARKWCDLAQRRLDYFVELYRSGRWTHYYTEESFALRMLDVIKAVRLWAELAPARPDDSDQDHLRPAA